MSVDTSFVPTTHGEVFSHYFGYIKFLVVKFGINPDAAEDVAMSILLKFYENDALSDFDPEYKSDTGAPSRFGGFLYGFISVYVRHYRDKQLLRATREPISVDKPMAVTSEDAVMSWLEVFGTPVLDDYSELMTEDFIRTARKHLSTLRPRGVQDSFQALLFFEAVVVQWQKTEVLDTKELAKTFNVTGSTILNWRKRLFVELKPLLGVS